jgi:signal transduction histidine kinase
VRLIFLPDKLKVSVEDHGKGFIRESGQRGIGLVAMRERAGIVGGTLAVEAAAGTGTIVQVEIPREKVEAQVG